MTNPSTTPEPDTVVYENPAMRPPDITRDRVMCIVGGTIVTLHADALERFSDAGAVWVNMIPCEKTDFEKNNPNVWPRERPIRVLHSFYYGTVDEIADDFRAKLRLAWNATAAIPPEGQPQPVI